MTPVSFPESNKTLTPPRGMTRDECGDLPVYTDGKTVLSCWALTWRERLSILLTGRLWLWVWSGETQPPVSLQAESPFYKPTGRAAHVFFDRYVVSTCRQAQGAPVVDEAFIKEPRTGRTFRGLAIRPPFTGHRPVTALVVGRLEAKVA